MKIPRPKKIQVGGRIYQIILDPTLHAQQGDWGQVNHAALRILVDGFQADTQKTISFLHEIIHTINHVYCNSHIPEDDIDALGEGLYQVVVQLGVDVDWGK